MTTNTKDYSINKPNFAIKLNNNLSITNRKLFNHLIFEFSLIKFSSNTIILDRENIKNIIPTKLSLKRFKEILDILQTTKLTSLDNDIRYKDSCYISAKDIDANDYQIEISTQLLNGLNINYVDSKGTKRLKEGYTKLNLNIVNILKGKNSIPTYELMKCLSFKKNTFNLSLDYLYNFLVKDKETYENFKSFNQKVLKPAITEINKKTDIFVKFKLIKKGTKVISIDFLVFENNKQDKILEA